MIATRSSLQRLAFSFFLAASNTTRSTILSSIEYTERKVVQLNRLYSNLNSLFTPIHFNAAKDARLLNVIFAEVRRKKSKKSDSHNLGKTTLIELIDFMLLKEITGSDHFLEKHKERFHNFNFCMEIALHDGGFATVCRSVSQPTQISLKRSVDSIENCFQIAEDEWDHRDATLSAARDALNAYLNLKMVAPWDYRTGVSYFLRTQADYTEYFQIQKFMQGKDRAWKPYLARILGLNYEAVAHKYQIEDEILDKQSEQQKKIAEIDPDNQDRGELVTRIAIARDEISEAEQRLDGFDFHEAELEINKRVVDAVEARLSEISENLYDVDVDIAQLEKSISVGIKFDIKRIEQIFTESELLLPASVTRSYEELVDFNRKLTKERNKELRARLTKLRDERDGLVIEHKRLSDERQKLFAIVQQADTFRKYKALQKQQSLKQANLAYLEGQLARVDNVADLERSLRELRGRRDAATTAIEISLSRGSPIKQNITILFNRYVARILDINGEFIVTGNSSGNLEFAIRTKDVTGGDTSQDRGHSYHRTLCALFDLAVLKALEDTPFYHFVYHDGIFEGFSNGMKLRMLDLIREVIGSGKIQYIFSIIDADLPRDEDTEQPVKFATDEIVLELNDQGDSGRLFKMPPF
ncbi:DUF2326 domain-containing protein [Tardiphaga alba]|uniref:DUF2326 domain-containing protein n=1 Tax=Tardiphaga alba TaxID=340268 RepID=A0ABX8ADN2_9BRAD|nr:DUF2326 domain-containing protein [Tardiphaga alba]QUS41858.1 DUF2326 domain-containing protein [Tardiphaga alba]